MAAKTLIFFAACLKTNLQSVMEYRTNFLIQTISMFLNDIVWMIFWFLFFSKFPIINNWFFSDMIVLYAVITIAWGLQGIIFGNFEEIADIIKEGKLDFYLALPKEELLHILISNTHFSAYGDFFFGIAMLFFIDPVKYPLLLLLIVLSTVIIVAFDILLGSLAFFFGSATEMQRTGRWGMIALASYPQTLFKGFAKFILLVIIPAGFITGVPVELLKNFSLKWLLYMAGYAILLLAVAIWVFKIGVKKYESGNLINVRV